MHVDTWTNIYAAGDLNSPTSLVLLRARATLYKKMLMYQGISRAIVASTYKKDAFFFLIQEMSFKKNIIYIKSSFSEKIKCFLEKKFSSIKRSSNRVEWWVVRPLAKSANY